MLQNCQPRRNFKSFRPWRRFRQPEKASDGSNGCEVDDVANVERHFGKHTGLRHSAKARPEDAPATETSSKAGGGDVRTNQARPASNSGREAMGVSFDKIDGVIWYDGKLVPWADANVHVLT